AERLDYRRAGARMEAVRGGAVIDPDPGIGIGIAAFGSVRFIAERVEGEIANRRGIASGAVRVDTSRGDTARTERGCYDGDFLRSDVPVAAEGPGYRVDDRGMDARTDGTSIRLTDGVVGQLQTEARR